MRKEFICLMNDNSVFQISNLKMGSFIKQLFRSTVETYWLHHTEPPGVPWEKNYKNHAELARKVIPQFIQLGPNRQKVFEIRQEHPNKSATEIAIEVGISRERVRQILTKLGLPTKVRNPYIPRHCRDCGRILSKTTKGVLCFACFNLQRRKETLAELTCFQCRKTFYRSKALHNIKKEKGYKHTFCNRKCLGRWLGLNYGYGKKSGEGITSKS